jgi:hypothetical protein
LAGGGGGEHERLHSFFRQVGIIHHVSCPYTQQQNGVAERKHRHIVEMGLSLLATAAMPLKYWDEAFLAATYLINRTPAKLLNFDTPLHMLVGATPDYSSFRVFGCACWPNLRSYNSHKLQYRSIRCVFLGYSNMHKGFKCLDISTGRLYISQDVVFDEKTFPFAALHSTAGPSYSSDVLLYDRTTSEGVRCQDQLERFSVKREHNQYIIVHYHIIHSSKSYYSLGSCIRYIKRFEAKTTLQRLIRVCGSNFSLGQDIPFLP